MEKSRRFTRTTSGSRKTSWRNSSESYRNGDKHGSLRETADLADLLGQHRDGFEEVTDDAVIGDVEDRRFGIFIDGHDRARVLHSDQVLDRAGDSEGHVKFRRDRLSG